MNFQELIEEVKNTLPNKPNKYYKIYAAEDTVPERMAISNGLAIEIFEYLIEHDLKPRDRVFQTIDNLTDYILADDHARGTALRREVNEFA
ncbi:hypothetical protein QUF84_21040 [Fictibacillus enclensis]|uniref:hypothetical protein n=1 Tax=Fictibacillus enclensis TaxID=1017270 RepID=UPI0025A05FBE|nr:hypothetical protein [Fictibacillus enclensis]MDM5339689.1 hypothetical protein [Fictibacillus enclensis]